MGASIRTIVKNSVGNLESLAEVCNSDRYRFNQIDICNRACLEEVALNQGWLEQDQFEVQAHQLEKRAYGSYLIDLLEEANS